VLPLQSDFSRGYGAVLDSGTTFTYLPSSAYKAFLTALTAAIQHHPELKRASGKDPSVSVCTVLSCIRSSGRLQHDDFGAVRIVRQLSPAQLHMGAA
jgi:hypothetical protein